jgi:hypothetical protein
MYGKIFASLYEGSMVGAGPVVFAVWGYCIAKAEIDGTVLLNPTLLAAIIGTSKPDVNIAINYLSAPDEHSKNQDHDGRRLLHRTGHLYFVVSHDIYRNMKSNEERRKYMREYMSTRRNCNHVNSVNSLQSLQGLQNVNPASVSSSSSLSKKGECEGDGDESKPSKAAKKAFGEFSNVMLTSEEHAALIAKHGANRLDEGIGLLGSWLASTGKRRKSHYACLSASSWVWQRIDEQKTTKSSGLKNVHFANEQTDAAKLEARYGF